MEGTMLECCGDGGGQVKLRLTIDRITWPIRSPSTPETWEEERSWVRAETTKPNFILDLPYFNQFSPDLGISNQHMPIGFNKKLDIRCETLAPESTVRPLELISKAISLIEIKALLTVKAVRSWRTWSGSLKHWPSPIKHSVGYMYELMWKMGSFTQLGHNWPASKVRQIRHTDRQMYCRASNRNRRRSAKRPGETTIPGRGKAWKQ